jgi:FkbM family methyltransferase
MNLRKVFLAGWNRCSIVARYAAAAPGIPGLPPWLFLGALRSRLVGGDGRWRANRNARFRNYRVPVGRNRGEDVIVDITSFAELDVLQELLVDRIYPLDRIGFVPAMILDCGANIGYFASLCRLRFPKAEIICWEPDAHNFSRLVTQPMLKCTAVECHLAAVSDQDGETTLTGSGTGCKLGNNAGGRGGQRIKTINLRRWIAEYARAPLLIKIDIEGHEAEIVDALAGAWMTPCVLFLETHAEMGRDERLMSQLRREGFELRLLRSHELPGDERVFKEYMGTLGMALA